MSLMWATWTAVNQWPAAPWSRLQRAAMLCGMLMELCMPLIPLFPAEGSALHGIFTAAYGAGTHLTLLMFLVERSTLQGADLLVNIYLEIASLVCNAGSIAFMGIAFWQHMSGAAYWHSRLGVAELFAGFSGLLFWELVTVPGEANQ
ncbi:uncharacterized protein [Dermacentor albipictus]|uniref:uncharacterized protein isoform X2 n=1 Tax=Dermacentor albipictus TaxID=60249 RepID=UPI0038FC6A24